jgi:poly(3-hydroxybutyrate) depolymerase
MLTVNISSVFLRVALLASALSLAACGGGGGDVAVAPPSEEPVPTEPVPGEEPAPTEPEPAPGEEPAPTEPEPTPGEEPAAPSAVTTVTLDPYPHEIDVFATSGATRALVFLHGGGGVNSRSAYELGINLIDAPPTTASANWTWLEANRILAVFPQGQALPNDGVRTWSNHVMDSGQDDVAFLQALASHIAAEYGITDIYLAGHSNGGMMANRMWCESAATYKGYIAISGPASNYYSTTACTPAVYQPYLGIAGELDTVLQVEGNWEAPTWTIDPALVALKPDSFLDPVLIGEWVRHQARAQAACGESPVIADRTSDGAVESWSNCGGSIQLHRALTGEHSIESLETATGYTLIDVIAAFIDGV